VLADLGAEVIDADALVHALQRPGTRIHADVVQHFGPSVLHGDGTLNRARLGMLVFADAGQLAWLEALIHPAVIAETERLLASASAPVLVVEAVKLVEAGMRRLCDSLWLVVCRPEVQLARLVARGTDETDARARIAAQPSVGPKRDLANVVIDNSGTVEETRTQVIAAWRRLDLR
jgi:dephospho-CoA kinase